MAAPRAPSEQNERKEEKSTMPFRWHFGYLEGSCLEKSPERAFISESSSTVWFFRQAIRSKQAIILLPMCCQACEDHGEEKSDG